MRGNCLAFALCAWWRNRGAGYLLIRRSRFGPFPHFLYLRVLPPDADVAHFVPLRPRRRWLPPLWFVGRLARCDRAITDCQVCGRKCERITR